MVEDKIKTCANCAHFEILEEGYEIGRIEDLKYMQSRCRELGREAREHYAFEGRPGGKNEIRRTRKCPQWKQND